MLSVAESAEKLGVSPARVRALIASGALPAQKIGRAWVLDEVDVMNRLLSNPRPGRPAFQGGAEEDASSDERAEAARIFYQNEAARARELYLACKGQLSMHPSSGLLEAAQSQEEAAFYVAVSDFFLQQKQRELIKKGAF